MATFDGTGEEPLSGLAGDIRSSLESEQYDLGGYTESRARDLMISAFKNPLSAPEKMIKITFVVGGGKLVRSKYSDDLPKWIVAALREIGYSEDRSAAETFDSQGTFKQQHDTGQNLKYLIVYPKVTCSNAGDNAKAVKKVDLTSPEYLIVSADKSIFQDMIASKVTSYAQKKRVQKLLQDKLEEYKSLEAKLVSGSLLTPEEQASYDNSNGQEEEKIIWINNEMKTMVEKGLLTAREKIKLLKQIEINETATLQEIEQVKAENKPKKLEKLQQKLPSIAARKESVTKITPIPPQLSRPQIAEEIRRHHIQLFPLRSVEEKSRSMSLTIADLKLLETKSDLEVAIKELEESCRGWFQEEEEFQEQCQAEEATAKAKYKQLMKENVNKKSSGGCSGVSKIGGGTTNKVVSKSSSSSSSWSTVSKKPGSGSYASSLGSKKAAGGSASFAALGDDDDD